MKHILLSVLLFFTTFQLQAAPTTLRIQAEKEATIALSFNTLQQRIDGISLTLDTSSGKVNFPQKEVIRKPYGMLKEMELEQASLTVLSVGKFRYVFWINPGQDLSLHLKEDTLKGWIVTRAASQSQADEALFALNKRFPALFGHTNQVVPRDFDALQVQMKKQIGWYEKNIAQKLNDEQQILVESWLYWRPIVAWPQLSEVITKSARGEEQVVEWKILEAFLFSAERLHSMRVAKISPMAFTLFLVFNAVPPGQSHFLDKISRLPLDREMKETLLALYLSNTCKASAGATNSTFSAEIQNLLEKTDSERVRTMLKRACY